MKCLKSKKVSYKFLINISAVVFLFASCTKAPNIDEKLITDKMLEQDANEGGILLPGMMKNILQVDEPWNYEFQQNLNADYYSGYMALPQPYFADINNFTYFMIDSWNAGIWSVPATRVLDQWVVMKKKGFDTKYPDLYSIGLILKTFVGHRLVDTFGPIPYSQYGSSSDVKFDSEQEAYDVFFSDLRQAVEGLKKAEADNPDADKIRFAKFDKSQYGGDYAKWIKLANTLRLRLAMRLSYIDPAKARTEAEAAVSDGVLSDAEGSFTITASNGHPLATITSSWQETRLGAPVETILGGYNDPRLSKYALPSTDPALNNEIKGMRQGISFPSNDDYIGFSQVKFEGNPPVKLMDVAESYFLRAEGDLRGWNMGGAAKDFYEQGIRASFKENGVGGEDEYINNTTSTPKAYVDPKNPANNAGPLTSLTIKWEEGATMEQKLERIITQKWISMYPEGQEAWSEFRRTGYPKLYPVMVNNSRGDIPNGEFIKRITYPTSITNASAAATAEAVSKFLDGKDKLFTPIWWDVH
ncbi:SusD/RagB family nutrient-binding outer membrane lipoprotein [Segetibacter koreensis]|uniref:SusD/RagB family nutrient-binding outer membrane lipoprotein n=1 Tax=Segetibacter koreensis TaxID=398037 RepID=UPI0003805E50|nr:SusD/RagB family nutrient-binding outer membrane lipoprotein [Segetibacter koreensis]